MSEASTKDFCNALRKYAVELANGSRELLTITDFQLSQSLPETECKKINSSYIRTVMNRVPEVKENGTVKVMRVKATADEVARYEISINREPKRKVFTENDLPGIKKAACKKLANDLIAVMPNISDLEGEQLQGAAIAIKRYQDLIKLVTQGE